jgi:hypothetical protein
MALAGWNSNNRYALTVSGGAVDEDLTDFPMMITLSSSVAEAVFDELTTISGILEDSDTKLLLHGTGGDGAFNSHPILTNGNLYISTEVPSGLTNVNYSFYLDGVDDFLDIGNDSDLDFGTEDFTIDCWFKSMDLSTRQCIFGQYTNGGDIFQIFSRETAEGNNIQLRTVGSNPANGFGYVIADNDWHHMAIMRDGGTTKLAIDGVFAPNTPINNDNLLFLDKSLIGARGNLNDSEFKGYICEFRLSKGIVRWPTTFSGSLPTERLVPDNYTTLLVQAEGDRSASGHDVTFNNSTGIEMSSSFGRFNGSYYFPGTASDYISIADHADFDFGTDDFTIDWWEYRDSTAGMSISKDASAYESIVTNYTSGGTLVVYMSSNNGNWDIASAKLMSSGQHDDVWAHYAVVRSGINFYTFKNGIQQDTWTSALSLYNSEDPLKIGSRHGGANFKGYMSEVRVSSIARWTSNFKPPDSTYGSSYDNRKKIAITDSSDNELYVEIENWSDIDGISEDLTRTAAGVRYGIQADSEFNSTYTAAKAFLNDESTTQWRTTATAFPHWIGYNFVTPVVSNVLHIYNGISPYDAPTFQIHGSNDITNDDDWSAKSWTTIVTVSGTNADKWNTRTFDNDTAYIYYRLYATENSAAGNSWYIAEIEFQVTPTRKEATLWTKIPTLYTATDTVLYLYYDNDQTTNSGYVGDTGELAAQNVWNSSYQLVYHFNNWAGSMLDSTGSGINAVHGITSGSDNFIRGISGNTMKFTNDEYMVFADLSASNFPTNEGTIEILLSSDSSDHRGIHQVGAAVGGYYPVINEGNAPYYRAYEDAFRSTRINYDLDIVVDPMHVYTIYSTPGANGWEAYQNETVVHQDTGDASITIATNSTLGCHTAGGGGTYFTGRIGDYRISNIRQSDAWRKAVYDSYFGNLVEYAYSPPPEIYFVFSDEFPTDLSTTYGTSEQLQITTTLSGSEPSYTYDATFYDDGDVQIGSTSYGVNSGSPAYATMSTLSGIDYMWYVTATSSGLSESSDTYTFSNRFLCAGYTEDSGVSASGIPVRLYRRSTGELEGSATSTGINATFEIGTRYYEEHYAVALYFDEDTNALIFDRIEP